MPSRRRRRTRMSRVSIAATISTHSKDFILAWQMESDQMWKEIITGYDSIRKTALFGQKFKASFMVVHKRGSIYLVLLIFEGIPKDFAGVFTNTFVQMRGGIPCKDPALLKELSSDAWTEYRKSQTS